MAAKADGGVNRGHGIHPCPRSETRLGVNEMSEQETETASRHVASSSFRYANGERFRS
jgi:hypothetical protein